MKRPSNWTTFGGLLAATAALAVAPPADAQPCELPDNGSGTVTLPDPNCPYLSPDDFHMVVDGLPPGTEIIITGIHRDFICKQQGVPQEFCNNPGGALGGEEHFFDSTLEMQMQGTGALAGFNRTILLPIQCIAHTSPTIPGQAVQNFDNDMFQLQGAIFGDPDFDQLQIVAGTAFGLPSPGQTTLTRLGPPGSDFQVDSFFDITYRIDFQGAPGSVLDGLGGSTLATVRMQTGGPGGCQPAPFGCQNSPDCPAPNECVPACVNFDPATGQTTVIACDCRGPNACQVGVVPPPVADGPGGNPCVVVENPPGTVTLPPPGCEYLSPDEVHMIIDGLPAGTTIELAPIHRNFICKYGGAGLPGCPPPGTCEIPGGNLGGNVDCFTSELELAIQGTGALAGFNRNINLQVNCQVHTGPRNPGDPVQAFDNEMVMLQGALFGDPDFDQLIVTAGSGLGLPPSPGQTTLTDLGNGTFNVDSFFDITYQIEFQGAPGSILEGLAGTTTATIRMATGGLPECFGTCPPGTECVRTVVTNADGTVDVCCDCVPIAEDCGPTPDGAACLPAPCPDTAQTCVPISVDFDPLTGAVVVTECACLNPDECRISSDLIQVPGAGDGAPGNPCTVTNTGGTVVLPPPGCEYLSPDEVHVILDGLPAGTTIEFAPIHKDFICKTQPGAGFPGCPPPGVCEEPGGDLGGQIDCFSSNLELEVTGTGALAGFNRTLNVQLLCQVHTGPRNPGDAVQIFDTKFEFMQGALFGDPDFDILQFTAGDGNGLPSPGQTTLTRLGPPGSDFQVDSFFDITYRIDFQGAPGSVLDGLSGSTTATIRMSTGLPGPACEGGCPPGQICEEIRTVNADGTISITCLCVDNPCPADLDNSGDVGFSDVLVVIGNWGPCPLPCPPSCFADLSGNCSVDFADILVLIANWGPCP